MICDGNTLKGKDTKLKTCGSVKGGKVLKPMTKSKITSEPTFPLRKTLSTDSLQAKIKDRSLFGYVQCNLVVPDELKSKFLRIFLQFSKILRLEEMILEIT